MDPKTARQVEMLYNRLVKRKRHLSKWARRTETCAYRLYDRDIPEIPLVLDWYGPIPGGELSPAVAVSLYKRPWEKDEAEENAWLAAMKDASSSALGMAEEDIFFRERKRQRGNAQYEKLPEESCAPKTTVQTALRQTMEYGLHYEVNLSAYLDTGLFLDRRRLRAMIRSEAAGKKILNLFCYTGTISVAAASGGAASVDSVDMSAPYLSWAERNFRLNGLEPQRPFRFIRSDVLRFITDPERRKQSWDMIILDPPAFSNSKKMQEDFDLKRDHPFLTARCLRLLAPGGTLYLSASIKGFRLNTEALAAALNRTAKSAVRNTEKNTAGNVVIEDITGQLRDEDFRGKRIPASYRIHFLPQH